MSRVWFVARREWLEQRRQPGMLAAILATFVVIDGLVVLAAVLLALVPIEGNLLLGPSGADPAAMVHWLAGLVVDAHAFLNFSQLIGLCAVNAGHSVLHDRQTGAITFLLLAPLRRIELLGGKLMGAVAPPLAAGMACNAVAATALALVGATASAGAGRLPPSPGWFVAWALAGPAWCAFIAAICTVISALARDVRTAQQAVWFLLLFATILGGSLVTSQVGNGVGAVLAVAAVGALGAAVTLWVGAQLLSRDLSR